MMNNLYMIQERWDEILKQMVEDNDISEGAYTTWIKYFRPCEIKDTTLYVLVDKEFVIVDALWFTKKYRMPLMIAISEIIEKEFQVQFSVPHEEYIYEVRKIRNDELSE